ncbi:nwd2 [Moniliophthora roreri]|nr:nwd2 [Moniliophthora roreri]
MQLESLCAHCCTFAIPCPDSLHLLPLPSRQNRIQNRPKPSSGMARVPFHWNMFTSDALRVSMIISRAAP